MKLKASAEELALIQYERERDFLDFLELAYEEIKFPLYNPLSLERKLEFAENPVDEVIDLTVNTEYLHFVTKNYLNLNVMPYQLVILDALHNNRLPILLASRGAGKSFMLAVYAMTKMILEPGVKIVLVGAGLRQSRHIFNYMANIWKSSAILRDIFGRTKGQGPKREVDRFEFRLGDSLTSALPLGDGEKIRGERGQVIICDEYTVIDEEIFNVVVQGFALVSADPVEKVKAAKRIKRMKREGIWTPEMEETRLDEMKGNQIIRSGTPTYYFNHFYGTYKKWKAIIESKGDIDMLKKEFGDDFEIQEGFNWKDYAIIRLPYTELPEDYLDPGIISQARATLTKNQFLNELCATFVADSDGFYKRSVIEAATTTRPVMIPSGEKVQFSARKTGHPNKNYCLALDPAAESDNAGIVILEIERNHRKVVHCWTTNKEKYSKIKRYKKDRGQEGEIEDDYYRYIARKIRSFMRDFNIISVVIDSYGGGNAVIEALGSKQNCLEDELPIYPIKSTDPKKPNETDGLEGLHIIEALTPNNELNAEANHAMLKDLESKVLLFPAFDFIEMAKAVEMDKAGGMDYEDYLEMEKKVGSIFDSYEDVVNEIEELKNELETIVVTQTSGGREKFDTPEIKLPGMKKGRLRKDRYSALLYANWWVRNLDRIDPKAIHYTPDGKVSGARGRGRPKKEERKPRRRMYSGPGTVIFSKKNPWLNGR